MHLNLKEAGKHKNIPLTTSHARWLIDQKIAKAQPSYTLGCFDLQVENVAGVVAIGDLNINIEPKLPVKSLLWLLNYSTYSVDWRLESVELGCQNLTETFVSLLCTLIEEATQPGLLSGYSYQEDSLNYLRGRLRLSDQVNRHYGALYPLEVSYDEYGKNITENRILFSALLEAQDFVQSNQYASVSHKIQSLLPLFSGVSALTSGESLPSYRRSQLNSRYFKALDVAEMFLRRQGLDTRQGDLQGRGFLIDMPELFEKFVARALHREVPDVQVQEQFSTRFVTGQENQNSRLIRPDIVISRDKKVTLAMDTKYKRAKPKLSDLYQLNAYADTLDLEEVTLIYGEKVENPEVLTTESGKRIHIRGIDLSASEEDILRQIRNLAQH